MDTKLDFYKAFDIKPYKSAKQKCTGYKYDCIKFFKGGLLQCYSCKEHIITQRYPDITSKVLVELICINAKYVDRIIYYSIDYNSLAEEILNTCIELKRRLKDSDSMDNYITDVRQLFKLERRLKHGNQKDTTVTKRARNL